MNFHGSIADGWINRFHLDNITLLSWLIANQCSCQNWNVFETRNQYKLVCAAMLCYVYELSSFSIYRRNIFCSILLWSGLVGSGQVRSALRGTKNNHLTSARRRWYVLTEEEYLLSMWFIRPSIILFRFPPFPFLSFLFFPSPPSSFSPSPLRLSFTA